MDRVQLHTTLSWGILVSRREASTLGEEEDSVEALVRRHRTYPKHQPHIRTCKSILALHLTTKTSFPPLENQSVCSSDWLWTYWHRLVPLFICWKRWGVFVLFWFNTLSPFLYIWDNTKSRLSTMVHYAEWTLFVLNVVKSGLVLFRPRVSGTSNPLIACEVKETHISFLVRFMRILKMHGMRKRFGELKCTSPLASWAWAYCPSWQSLQSLQWATP